MSTTSATIKCTKPPAFNFVTLNLGNGVNEQKIKPFDGRVAQHLSDLEKMKPDMLCLQEFRKFPDALVDPQEFLSLVRKRLGNFRSVDIQRNPNDLAFGQAIVYNPKRFFPRQVINKWLSDTPDDISETFSPKAFGCTVLGVEFYLIRDGKIAYSTKDKTCPTVWVFNVHFPLDETAKLQSAAVLRDIVSKTTNGKPFVVAGDFNTFYDAKGSDQVKIMTDAGWTDLLAGPKLTINGMERKGTFLGYEGDPFKQDPEKLSFLDHIFADRIRRKAAPTIWATTEQLRTRSTPSDHLACVVEVELTP